MLRYVLTFSLCLFAMAGQAPVATAQQSDTASDTTSDTGAGTPQSDESLVTDFLAAAKDPDLPADSLAIILVPLTEPELAEVAGAWQLTIQNLLETIARDNLKIRAKNDDNVQAVRAALAAPQDRLLDQLKHYELVLENWATKGGKPEDIDPHYVYIVAVKSGLVSQSDIRSLAQNVWNWMTSKDGGLGMLAGVLGLVVAMWLMMMVARFVRGITERSLSRVPSLSRLLKRFVVRAVFWSVFVLGILLVLGLFGVNVTPLFAVFGGLSFILGFALQETLGNLASGLMIMVLKPFDTGDYIHVAGTSGTVDEMSVVSTQVRTFDNQVITIPNSKIWGDVITNVSASDERRVDLVFGIAYSDNAAHAIAVLTRLVKAHPMCLEMPTSEIFVGELGDSSVNIFCRPWCKTEDYWTVYWDLTGQAKEAFDAEGISIPFPQRDVHLYQTPASPAVAE